MLYLFPEMFDAEETLINVDMNAHINDEDLAKILISFLRRAIMDASGGNRIDNTLNEQERGHARSYLLDGYIKRYGYYYYDETAMKYTPKRNHEGSCEKFQPTEEPHYSPIPLDHILDFFNLDHEVFAKRIKQWQDESWDKANSWYINFVDETNSL